MFPVITANTPLSTLPKVGPIDDSKKMLLNDDSAKDMVVIQTLNESGDQLNTENYSLGPHGINVNDIMALNKSKVLPIEEEDAIEAARAEEEDAY